MPLKCSYTVTDPLSTKIQWIIQALVAIKYTFYQCTARSAVSHYKPFPESHTRRCGLFHVVIELHRFTEPEVKLSDRFRLELQSRQGAHADLSWRENKLLVYWTSLAGYCVRYGRTISFNSALINKNLTHTTLRIHTEHVLEHWKPAWCRSPRLATRAVLILPMCPRYKNPGV